MLVYEFNHQERRATMCQARFLFPGFSAVHKEMEQIHLESASKVLCPKYQVNARGQRCRWNSQVPSQESQVKDAV